MPIDISQRLKQIPPLWSERIITRWLFDTNQMPLKGHWRRRKSVRERRAERERHRQRERETERKKKKDRGQTKSERQRVSLSLSQLAVFQVITQVLPFSFLLALLLPLKVTLTAHTHTAQKALTVWAYRGTYIHLQSSLWIPFHPLKDCFEPVVYVC